MDGRIMKLLTALMEKSLSVGANTLCSDRIPRFYGALQRKILHGIN